MKKRGVGFMVVLLLVCVEQAMAMYNPQTGRFLSRDPRGELGFELMQRASGVANPNAGRVLNRQSIPRAARVNQGRIFQRAEERLLNEDSNPYLFVANDSINRFDVLGLLPVGFDSSSYNNCCCTASMIQAGRNWLENSYNGIEQSLLNSGVPRGSSDPNYSCISENGYLLGQMDPPPACWVCWLEHREKIITWPFASIGGRVLTWTYDHWVVTCESLPMSGFGEKIVFDYWEDRNASDYAELERSWPNSYPRDSIIGSYRYCSGTVSGTDADRSFCRPPPASP